MSGRPLFVYGTLLSEGSQAAMLGSRARRGAWVRGTLWGLPAGYPALALEGEGRVHGELVDDVGPLLSLLDHYEGVDEGLYRRVEVVANAALRRVPAWAYVMTDPLAHGGRVLPSGRWRPVLRR